MSACACAGSRRGSATAPESPRSPRRPHPLRLAHTTSTPASTQGLGRLAGELSLLDQETSVMSPVEPTAGFAEVRSCVRVCVCVCDSFVCVCVCVCACACENVFSFVCLYVCHVSPGDPSGHSFRNACENTSAGKICTPTHCSVMNTSMCVCVCVCVYVCVYVCVFVGVCEYCLFHANGF